MNNKKFLAIIPARGGSKRLPGKNIKYLSGKPLIAWTIEAAMKCSLLDRVIVSTDNNEIATIATKFGAEVPFLRPIELSGDTSSGVELVEHAVSYFSKEGKTQFEYVVFLQPTSPLRTGGDIHRAIEMVEKLKADSIVSVCEVDHSPLWCNTLPKDLRFDNFIPREVAQSRSQDLPKYFRINGAIYICRIGRLLSEKSFYFSSNSFAYIMNRDHSIDIDNQIDFDIAELYMSRRSVR